MTDRELLELAAKAAGMTGCGLFWDEKSHALWDGEGLWFDPLNDDGDALRLAVKVGITFRCMKHFVVAVLHYQFDERISDHADSYAAARRAITRAAAEIGRRMK